MEDDKLKITSTRNGFEVSKNGIAVYVKASIDGGYYISLDNSAYPYHSYVRAEEQAVSAAKRLLASKIESTNQQSDLRRST